MKHDTIFADTGAHKQCHHLPSSIMRINGDNNHQMRLLKKNFYCGAVYYITNKVNVVTKSISYRLATAVRHTLNYRRPNLAKCIILYFECTYILTILKKNTKNKCQEQNKHPFSRLPKIWQIRLYWWNIFSCKENVAISKEFILNRNFSIRCI